MASLFDMDDLRQSWCLLTLEAEQKDESEYVSGWSFAVANIDQLFEDEQQSIDSPSDEGELLLALGKELDRHRFQGRILVTPSRQTLQFFRSRLLEVDGISDPSLRGFGHIAVAELVQRNFNSHSIKDPEVESLVESASRTPARRNEPSALELWRVLVTVLPLVPPSDLEGLQL